MVLDVGAVLSLLSENIRRTGLPVPADRSVLWEWSRGLGLPRRGRVLLYTGGLYQLVPHIVAYARQLERLESSGMGRLAFRALGRVRRLSGLASLVVRPGRAEAEYSRRVLRSIVALLGAAGVRVAYDGEVDGYSGVLLYDMGLDSQFAEHASRVARAIMGSGAELVVTVDPHTTHVLRSVYPRYVDGFDVEVKSYLELLGEHLDEISFRRGPRTPVAIHDPCLYARFEGVIEEPRRLLERAGYEVRNPRRWGRYTYCCGGPVESVSPRLAGSIAERRVSELRETGAPVVAVMCPICLANLRRHAAGRIRVEDISILLAERLEGAGGGGL